MKKRREPAGEDLGPYTQANIGTHQHFRWLKGIIISILVLNVLDALLTIYVVMQGRAKEANPLMAELVEREPAAFFVVKLTLVSLGSYILWILRKKPLAVFSIFFAFLVYYGILIYHLRAMDLRLFDRLAEYLSG
jgi:hypothetical protein